VSYDFQVTLDCADPDRLARFWAEALGYKMQDPPPGFESWGAFLASIGVPEEQWGSRSAIVDPQGSRPRIFFQQVPESRASKNRVHLDLNAGGPPGTPPDQRRARADAEAQRLVAIGATLLHTHEELGERWIVLQDPEGNEFCIQ
jgi:hypothetical protein